MAEFVKDNLRPILLAALLALSGYLVEKTIANQVEISSLRREVRELRGLLRDAYSHLDVKIEKLNQ